MLMETSKEQLKAYLKKKKVSSYRLAKDAGISPSILSLFLNGKRGMTLVTWEKIEGAMKSDR